LRALIQRVRHASVSVNKLCIGEINQGLLVFLAIQKGDDHSQVEKLLDKVLAYRVFADEQGKMNLSLKDIQGGLLTVSQFTLAADTAKGLRPGFSLAATPEDGKRLYDYWLCQAEKKHHHTAAGEFGADMQVSLLNDGPVTFLLEC